MTLIRSANAKLSNTLTQFIPLPLLRAAYGLLLALGAPIGWIITQWLAGRDPFDTDQIDGLVYSYIIVTTSTIFSALGYVIGKREQVITYLALTDELTALYNKRYFKSRLEQEFQRHQRTESPFSVILIDLDFFKRVNDQFGHPAGDEVLKNISSTIIANCRRNEIAARVGGEEISIIACDCDLEAACLLAERIRVAIERSSINWQSTKIKITASFGVAAASTASTSAWRVYQDADQALYQAKKTGRNKICTNT
ncbi:MAG: diguanylate cyclase (GGDEF)-like protein [Oleiphilaceae bacterium]|jgi:diguanylate cyclase (GGDEF)-like protein